MPGPACSFLSVTHKPTAALGDGCHCYLHSSRENTAETCRGQTATKEQSQDLIQAAGSRTAALHCHCCVLWLKELRDRAVKP